MNAGLQGPVFDQILPCYALALHDCTCAQTCPAPRLHLWQLVMIPAHLAKSNAQEQSTCRNLLNAHVLEMRETQMECLSTPQCNFWSSLSWHLGLADAMFRMFYGPGRGGLSAPQATRVHRLWCLQAQLTTPAARICLLRMLAESYWFQETPNTQLISRRDCTCHKLSVGKSKWLLSFCDLRQVRPPAKIVMLHHSVLVAARGASGNIRKLLLSVDTVCPASTQFPVQFSMWL